MAVNRHYRADNERNSCLCLLFVSSMTHSQTTQLIDLKFEGHHPNGMGVFSPKFNIVRMSNAEDIS